MITLILFTACLLRYCVENLYHSPFAVQNVQKLNFRGA
jgi:hypothetical protein